ncbi:hypothetical protein CERSUDRAFT_112832 [Gelatoporia subvermispora B]|uniref:Uncharacterized protein n=1 Tax=Ceriporiopsis subvermispora (strain B) TaxID=914234 RepID=M2R3P7_CERS8|nr:hypothetical protein CERSUDRAFT_112832 [Gelatoporia subvermispora B]
MPSSVASSESSPNQSPTWSPATQRRLSARRGSVSASDPWGAYADVNLNPSRSLTSRLSIVRVPPQQAEEEGRRHRRRGSNASVGSSSSRDGGNRLSFAMSSFRPSSPVGGQPPSPTSSPRMRPTSPGLSRRHSGSGQTAFGNHPKLSPEQLVELARQSCNPRPAIAAGPGAVAVPALQPVSFTPLPESVYLPYVERAAEVTELVTHPPCSKILALLAQTFPPDRRTPATPPSTEALLNFDPRGWTYSEFEHWLTRVDRDAVPDALWVVRARACILAHSELLWSRIKGALGVPPELDVDEADLEPQPVSGARVIEGLPRDIMSAEEYGAVFEPESPEVLARPLHESVDADAAATLAEPTAEERAEAEAQEEMYAETAVSIEPIVASNGNVPPPFSTSVNPDHHALEEVREEDEDEDGAAGDGKDNNQPEEDIQGLRIVTSPTKPVALGMPIPSGSLSVVSDANPGVSPMSPLGGPLRASPYSGLTRSSPRFAGSASVGSFRGMGPAAMVGDEPYDHLRERGPGHPLFPSSFAHLSLSPTLGKHTKTRSQSMIHPPPSRADLARAGSWGAPRPASMGRRPDWARNFDPTRHEYAVASSAGSVSAHE